MARERPEQKEDLIVGGILDAITEIMRNETFMDTESNYLQRGDIEVNLERAWPNYIKYVARKRVVDRIRRDKRTVHPVHLAESVEKVWKSDGEFQVPYADRRKAASVYNEKQKRKMVSMGKPWIGDDRIWWMDTLGRLSRLPAEDQAILVLRTIEDLSHEAIGKRIGRGRTWVRERLMVVESVEKALGISKLEKAVTKMVSAYTSKVEMPVVKVTLSWDDGRRNLVLDLGHVKIGTLAKGLQALERVMKD